MATVGFTTTGLSKQADELLDAFHKQVGGQKRDVLSNLIIGLLTAEDTIAKTVHDTGKMISPAFTDSFKPELFGGVNFPIGHFMAGFSAKLTVDTLCNAKATVQPTTTDEVKDTDENQGKGKNRTK